MNDPERTLLCWKATRLIIKNGIVDIGYGDCDSLRERGFAGFAQFYLNKCSKSMKTADATFYKQLLEIDAKLGLTQTEQLSACVSITLRIELLEV